MSSIVCIGAVLIDEIYYCHEKILAGTSNPAKSVKSVGGVMSNIVRNLSQLEISADFITVTGNDTDADYLKSFFSDRSINTGHFMAAEESTGKYVSFLNADGSLFAAVCSDDCSSYITGELLQSKIELLFSACLIVADTNLDKATLEWLIRFSHKNDKKLIIEPVSVAKASKLSSMDLHGIFMITPNEEELSSLTNNCFKDEMDMVENLMGRGVENIWIRKGSNGSSFYNKKEHFDVDVPEMEVTDSTGAGDAALSGWIAGFIEKKSLIDSVKQGHSMAFETLKIYGSVNENINKEHLKTLTEKYYYEK